MRRDRAITAVMTRRVALSATSIFVPFSLGLCRGDVTPDLAVAVGTDAHTTSLARATLVVLVLLLAHPPLPPPRPLAGATPPPVLSLAAASPPVVAPVLQADRTALDLAEQFKATKKRTECAAIPRVCARAARSRDRVVAAGAGIDSRTRARPPAGARCVVPPRAAASPALARSRRAVLVCAARPPAPVGARQDAERNRVARERHARDANPTTARTEPSHRPPPRHAHGLAPRSLIRDAPVTARCCDFSERAARGGRGACARGGRG